MFLGSMDWEANVDAVNYFCEKIWPRVLVNIPDAKFRIVGRNPHPSVRKLACDSVQVTGTVPSVIDYLKSAAVVVVPLRIGGGTRLKIYEAMSMGKAIVSSGDANRRQVRLVRHSGPIRESSSGPMWRA
jgi:glycosyltransferase involved in cell wall biosynthesis